MKIDKVVPCTCIKYKPDSSVSTYYGMPILKVSVYDRGDKMFNYFEPVCPRCGMSMIGRQYNSAYLALNAWNEWMTERWEAKDPFTGEKYRDYDSLPSLMDGDGWAWNEPQASINKELEEWQ